MTFTHQSNRYDDYEIMSFIMIMSVFSAKMVILLILRGTLAMSVAIVIRVLRAFRVITIVRVIRVARIIRVIWVTEIIRVIRVIKTIKVFSVISASRVILLCLGVVGLFLNFSVVIFDKDKIVRTFRAIQVVRVVTGVTVVKVTIYIVINTFSVIAWLVGFLELLAL